MLYVLLTGVFLYSLYKFFNERDQIQIEEEIGLNIISGERNYEEISYVVNYKFNGKPFIINFWQNEGVNIDYIKTHLENYLYKPRPTRELLRKVVLAKLYGYPGEEDVSQLVKLSQGPLCNFYSDWDEDETKGIARVPLEWDYILPGYDLDEWDTLCISDSFGQIHNIDISQCKNRKIMWIPTFSLI